ncbi:uncharacterized protein [Eurosta solidaginis]|uniref:uncharacterized protein isoform X2 n=2 Tax=Eurosta solidaginis TaxID=178769 RepID=UPI003530E299
MISKRHLIHINSVKMNNFIAQFRRLQQEVSRTNPEYCKSNEEILVYMAQQFDELKRTFQRENATLRGQVNALVKELAEQKVVIDRFMHTDTAEVSVSHDFPIETEEDLAELNKTINNSNRDDFIKVMNLILQPEGILKSLKCILTDELVMKFNVEGVQGKKSLKQYGNFYRALLGKSSSGLGKL